MPALGLKLRLDRLTYALSAVITTGMKMWHKFIANTWTGANRLPDSSPVGTNTAALYTGRGLDFDGVNDVVTVGDTGVTVKTVVFYAFPDDTTEVFMQLQSTGAVRIETSSGTLSATGFTTPTLYVDGAAGSTITAAWQQIAVTSATGVSASNVLFGQSNTTYYTGMMSNVKFFSVELSAAQIAELYANPEQALPTGVSSAELVGWWTMAEGAGALAVNNVSAGKVGIVSGASWVNAVTGAPPQFGMVGKSVPIIFDGLDDFVSIPDSISLSISSGDNFTFVALITVGEINAIYGILGKNDFGSGSFNWFLRNGDNGLIFRVYPTGVDFIPNTALQGLIANKTSTVAVRVSGTDIDFFLNGTKYDASSSYIPQSLDNTKPLTLGCWSSGSFHFPGIIHMVAFWKTDLPDASIAAISSGTSTPDQISASNLKGYWINRGATTDKWLDESGNGNNASSVNGSPLTVVLPQGVTANKDVSGVALQYKNSGNLLLTGDAYALATDAATLDITAEISLEAWVKPFTVSAAQTIIGKNGSYALGITSGAKPVFTKWTGAASTARTTTFTTLTANVWAHLAVTYDGANVKIYINGALNTTTATTGAMDATSADVLFGALTSTTNLFNGYIDSTKVYNTILTANDILNNYNAEAASYL
jgi:hypothetical protein